MEVNLTVVKKKKKQMEFFLINRPVLYPDCDGGSMNLCMY